MFNIIMSKNYTLDQIILHILQNFSINQIVIWIGIIIFLTHISTYMNITLLQFMLIGIVVFFISSNSFSLSSYSFLR